MEGLGKYKLTKVITLTPRFIIKNNFSEPISFREHGVAPRGRSTIGPGERCPLQFIRIGDEKLLTVAIAGLNAQWCESTQLIRIFVYSMTYTLGLHPSISRTLEQSTSVYSLLEILPLFIFFVQILNLTDPRFLCTSP